MRLARDQIGYREAADDCGMSHATLNRIGRCCGQPLASNYLAVVSWLGSSPEDYLYQATAEDSAELEEA